MKNNPENLKTKDGLKKITKVVKAQASASVCVIAVWANTKKVKSYKDLEGPFVSFTLTGYHATFNFGLGSTLAIAGMGISTSKAGIAISAGTATFRPKFTNACRTGLSGVSNYFKGKAEDL